jgi:hypothetical protein
VQKLAETYTFFKIKYVERPQTNKKIIFGEWFRYSDWAVGLKGRTSNRGRVRDFSVLQNFPDVSGDPSFSFLFIMYRNFFSGVSGRVVKLTYHFHHQLRLRRNGNIPLLPIYAFI